MQPLASAVTKLDASNKSINIRKVVCIAFDSKEAPKNCYLLIIIINSLFPFDKLKQINIYNTKDIYQ